MDKQKKRWFDIITEHLRVYPDKEVWCNGVGEIMCKNESVANAISDMLEQLYLSEGESVVVCTGYYDPDEDKRNGEEDECTGWWYVTID